MKIITNRFFVTIIYCLIGISTVFAGSTPPPPPGEDDGPDPPPNVSIDESLFMFLIVALLFGMYIIYKRQKKQKLQ
jgi:hypothetical protein